MSAYAISSFIDGFFRGRDWRDGKDEAAYNRERQKKLDEITFNQDRRAQAEFDYTQGERERARANRDRIAAINEQGIAGINADMERHSMAAPSAPPLTVSTRGASSVLPTVMPQSAPAVLGALPANRALAAAAAAQPMPLTPAVPVATPSTPAAPPIAQTQPAIPQALIPAAGTPFPAPYAAPPAQGVGQIVPNMPMPSNAVLQTTGPGPTGRIDPALYEMGVLPRRFQGDPMASAPAPQVVAAPTDFDMMARTAAAQAMKAGNPTPNPNHDFFQPGGLVADAAEAGTRMRAGTNYVAGGTVGMGVRAIQGFGNGLRDVVNAPLTYAFGEGARLPNATYADQMTQPAAPAPQAPPATASQPTAAAPQASAPTEPLGPLKSKLPASATPDQQAAASAVSAALNPAAPSTAVLAATAPTGMGAVPDSVAKGQPLPKDIEARKARATAGFKERYAKDVAPRVMEELLRQGDVEGAMKYQEWIDAAATQQAMKDWAGAAFSASIGDTEGFLDNYANLFNNNDYLGNGLTIRREDSTLTKDADGNVTGAVIILEDENGNTYPQVFDDLNDMVEMAMIYGSPENALAIAQERAKAAGEEARGAIKKAEDQADERSKFIRDTALKLMEDDGDLSTPIPTEEEATQMAVRIFDAGKAQTAQESLGVLPPDAEGQQPVIAFRP